ncbi:MAG: AAA family ATPase [Candidatus Omnitrophica bacterium]|nr:AAA family ATPase [Candidatus Omnitrophota bacterium]
MEGTELLRYWDLKEKPFENTCDPRFFYYSPYHKEALVRLVYVIKENKAGALLAGDYGTGKTTIASELLSEIEKSDSFRSVYISNPLLTSRELIQEIAYQLGVKKEGSSRPELRRAIGEALREVAAGDQHTIIIVDEAHLVTRKEALEELRLMMNAQFGNRFLSTIIMMGQLEMRNIIDAMPQFKQRFAMCYVLKHLDEKETAGYIEHRLSIAGGRKEIFTGEACSLIHSSSGGRPRQINNICDMSLLVACMRKAERVDEGVVREVARDFAEENR